MLRIRNEYRIFKIYGDFEDISQGHSQVFAYTRTLGRSKIFVILNFKEKEVDFPLAINEGWKLRFILGNYDDVKGEALVEIHSTLHMRAYEGRVYDRSNPSKYFFFFFPLFSFYLQG